MEITKNALKYACSKCASSPCTDCPEMSSCLAMDNSCAEKRNWDKQFEFYIKEFKATIGE